MGRHWWCGGQWWRRLHWHSDVARARRMWQPPRVPRGASALCRGIQKLRAAPAIHHTADGMPPTHSNLRRFRCSLVVCKTAQKRLFFRNLEGLRNGWWYASKDTHPAGNRRSRPFNLPLFSGHARWPTTKHVPLADERKVQRLLMDSIGIWPRH